MTEEERIAITKHHIRHLILARKLGVSTVDTDAVKWLKEQWDTRDDAQMREYSMLWNRVMDEWVEHHIKEMQDEQ